MRMAQQRFQRINHSVPSGAPPGYNAAFDYGAEAVAAMGNIFSQQQQQLQQQEEQQIQELQKMDDLEPVLSSTTVSPLTDSFPASSSSSTDEEKEDSEISKTEEEDNDMSPIMAKKKRLCHEDLQDDESTDYSDSEFERIHLKRRRLLMKKVVDVLTIEERYNAATAHRVLSNIIADPSSEYTSSYSSFLDSQNEVDDEGEEDWVKEYRLEIPKSTGSISNHVDNMRQHLKVLEQAATQRRYSRHPVLGDATSITNFLNDEDEQDEDGHHAQKDQQQSAQACTGSSSPTHSTPSSTAISSSFFPSGLNKRHPPPPGIEQIDRSRVIHLTSSSYNSAQKELMLSNQRGIGYRNGFIRPAGGHYPNVCNSVQSSLSSFGSSSSGSLPLQGSSSCSNSMMPPPPPLSAYNKRRRINMTSSSNENKENSTPSSGSDRSLSISESEINATDESDTTSSVTSHTSSSSNDDKGDCQSDIHKHCLPPDASQYSTISLEEALKFSPNPQLVTGSAAPYFVVHANAAYTRLTGINGHDVTGKKVACILVCSSSRTPPLLDACVANGAGDDDDTGSSGEEWRRQDCTVDVTTCLKDCILQQAASPTDKEKIDNIDDKGIIRCQMRVLPVKRNSVTPVSSDDENNSRHQYQDRTNERKGTKRKISHFLLQLHSWKSCLSHFGGSVQHERGKEYVLKQRDDEEDDEDDDEMSETPRVYTVG